MSNPAVTIRELRNHGGEVVDRVAAGERLTVTRAGKAVAELRPLSRPGVAAEELLMRWRNLPHVDAPLAQGHRRRRRPVVVTAPRRRARGLLDTSTVILLPELDDATALPEVPCISAITLAELSVGPLVATSDSERAARQAHVQQAEADFEPRPFDAQAARAFGQVAASLRQAGRKASARSHDAMIAATAVANSMALYTCHPSDFAGIDHLEVIEVPYPAG